MSMAMVIAPGERVDRLWAEADASAFLWERPVRAWTADALVAETSHPEPRRAYRRRARVRGWRVPLAFFIDTRLGGRIPDGYVLPGRVEGQPVEQVRVCSRCYGHPLRTLPVVWDTQGVTATECNLSRCRLGLAVLP